MIFGSVDTTIAKKQGNIGVAKAVYEYTKMGYTVLAPLSDSDKYDLVIDVDGNLLKVQVKTSRCKTPQGGYTINLKTSGGNTKVNTIRRREATDYDVLFAVTEVGDSWSIPVEALGDAGSSIVVTAQKYDQYKL